MYTYQYSYDSKVHVAQMKQNESNLYLTLTVSILNNLTLLIKLTNPRWQRTYNHRL